MTFQHPSGLKTKSNTWSRVHRWTPPLDVVLVFVPVTFVSDSFESGLPRRGLGIAGCAALGLFARIYYKRLTGK